MVLVSVEQIAQIATIVSGSLTALALIIVGLIMFIKLVNKAKRPDSDGGSKITLDEWVAIGKKILPFVFKLIDLASKEEEKPVQEKVNEKKVEENKVEFIKPE